MTATTRHQHRPSEPTRTSIDPDDVTIEPTVLAANLGIGLGLILATHLSADAAVTVCLGAAILIAPLLATLADKTAATMAAYLSIASTVGALIPSGPQHHLAAIGGIAVGLLGAWVLTTHPDLPPTTPATAITLVAPLGALQPVAALLFGIATTLVARRPEHLGRTGLGWWLMPIALWTYIAAAALARI